MINEKNQICVNCVMDQTDQKIVFDENGVCDHCNTFYNEILTNWDPSGSDPKILSNLAEEIKAVCEDLTFTNRVIHKALEEFDIILSESAVRRYRVKYGIVEE